MISYIVLPFAANTSAVSDRPDIRLRRTLYWSHDHRSRRFWKCFAQLHCTCSHFEVVVDHNTTSGIICNDKLKLEIFYFFRLIYIILFTYRWYIYSKSSLILHFVLFAEIRAIAINVIPKNTRQKNLEIVIPEPFSKQQIFVDGPSLSRANTTPLATWHYMRRHRRLLAKPNAPWLLHNDSSCDARGGRPGFARTCENVSRRRLQWKVTAFVGYPNYTGLRRETEGRIDELIASQTCQNFDTLPYAM